MQRLHKINVKTSADKRRQSGEEIDETLIAQNKKTPLDEAGESKPLSKIRRNPVKTSREVNEQRCSHYIPRK